jgi:hypothetical protein
MEICADSWLISGDSIKVYPSGSENVFEAKSSDTKVAWSSFFFTYVADSASSRLEISACVNVKRNKLYASSDFMR